MIEPVRGQIDTYDVSCDSCGVVERIKVRRYGDIGMELTCKNWLFERQSHNLLRRSCPECCAGYLSPETDIGSLFDIEIEERP